MRKRIVALAACLAASCLGLSGCDPGSIIGAVRSSSASPVIDAAEQLAVVQAERQIQRVIGDTTAAIEARAPSPAEAVAIGRQAMVALAAVQVARIAYDVTLRPSAAAATIAAIEAARKQTDEAYDALQERLARIISPPV